jgi:hypothetical protein
MPTSRPVIRAGNAESWDMDKWNANINKIDYLRIYTVKDVGAMYIHRKVIYVQSVKLLENRARVLRQVRSYARCVEKITLFSRTDLSKRSVFRKNVRCVWRT